MPLLSRFRFRPRPRKKLTAAMIAAAGLGIAIGSLAEGQDTKGEPPPTEATVERSPKKVVKGPRLQRPADSAQLREFSLVGTFQVDVPAGTRWQVERPLEEHSFLLVLNPSPERLPRQLAPYRHLADLEIALERYTPEVAVIRVRDKRHRGIPLLVHVGQNPTPRKSNRLLAGTAQRGVTSRAGPLSARIGRLKRFGPWQEFCRLVRTPLELELDEEDPESMMFMRAEALFAHGEDRGAREIYEQIAGKMELPPLGVRPASRTTADYTPADLAALRLADVSLCLGNVRAARLRYEVIYQAKERRLAEILAGLKWVQLAYPEVDQEEARSLARAVNRPERSPLVHRSIVHAARVHQLVGEQQEAMNAVTALDGVNLPRPYQRAIVRLKQRALATMVIDHLTGHEDVKLVLTVRNNEDVFWSHPRARTIAVETAEAFVRLLLPGQAIELLQTALVKLEGLDHDPLVVGALARAYRDYGDKYRASKTLDFLVEEMGAANHWLGRREEAMVSLAAAETALEQGDLEVASTWLNRARSHGGGPSVIALHEWVVGTIATRRGDHVAAAEHMAVAHAQRRYLSPVRRDAMMLDVARSQMKAGRHGDAERTLRILMEETFHVDVEREAAVGLAAALAKQGELDKARAVTDEVAAAGIDDTFAILGREQRSRIDFMHEHGSLIQRLVARNSARPATVDSAIEESEP